MRTWTLMCLAAVLVAACSSSEGGSDVENGAPGGDGGAGDVGGSPGQGGQPSTGGGGQGGKNTGGWGGAGPQECNSFNCEGCCWEGVCHTGTDDDACGADAFLCAPCSSKQLVCKPGGYCGVDPNTKWRVQPVSAKIASTNNGSEWDGDGDPPDVEVNMTCPALPPASPTYGTAPEYGNFNPTWDSGGCVTTAGALLASPWKYQLMDVDWDIDDTITGYITHQITEDEFDVGFFHVGPSGGMVTMKVELQKQ